MRLTAACVVALLMAVALAVQTGCGAAGSTPTRTPVVQPPTVVPATSTPASTPAKTATAEKARSPEVERVVQLAREDLSRRQGVAESDIRVEGVTSETWRDTSLGCPEPGKAYAQVLVPGYRIVLEARGKRYEYHSDSSRVVFCGTA